MKGNFEQCLALTLKEEGGFANHPKDPGGITNLGVTKRNWEDFLGRSVTETEMRALKPDDVIEFYRKRYWDKIKADELPMGVDFTTFDYAVNSGPAKAARVLQRCVNVTADGMIGPITLDAVDAVKPLSLIQKINDNRSKFVKSLPTYSVFGKGWDLRIKRVLEISTKMASEDKT